MKSTNEFLEELTGRVNEDGGRFYERYFVGKAWSNEAGVSTKSQ